VIARDRPDQGNCPKMRKLPKIASKLENPKSLKRGGTEEAEEVENWEAFILLSYIPPFTPFLCVSKIFLTLLSVVHG
jgi:hypothetical protein